MDEEPRLEFLKALAQAGGEGVFRSANKDAIDELGKRDSEATLIRRKGSSYFRMHHYSHALYLHGVKGPHEPNVEDKIKKVKEKFGMNAKVSSA